MLTLLLTALAAMTAATLIQHLGLAEAVAGVLTKVVSCSQCFTFWSTLAALLYRGADVVLSVLMAIVMAYASNWLVLLLMFLQRKFSNAYEKERTKQGRSGE